MALNPIVYTEQVIRSFLRYQLTAYPFADGRLLAGMQRLRHLLLAAGFEEGVRGQQLKREPRLPTPVL